MKADDVHGDGRVSEGQSRRGYECGHCLRRCGTLAGGYATIAGVAVCSRPTVDGRPDCYRMVTAKFHRLRACLSCMDPQVDRAWPRAARRSGLNPRRVY